MKPKTKENKKCFTCKRSGKQFKIAGLSHVHCEHAEKYPEEDVKNGAISAWDTLREFWNTCEYYEKKTKETNTINHGTR